MKITYNQNPLATSIELDEHEKRELWYQIKIDEMVDMLFTVHYELARKGDKAPDMDRIKKEVDPAYYLSDDERNPLDTQCDEQLAYFIEELKGQHVGDCTCVAMSCSKCHAESKLGIDTIKGLGKHPGYHISRAFSYKEGDIWKERTLDEALEYLRTYNPTPEVGSGWDKVGGFEIHIPRWTAEAMLAYDWLLEYQAQHFPKETP